MILFPARNRDPVTGLTPQELGRAARDWWDRLARHLARSPDLKNPDLAPRNGILQGLPWDQLTRAEGIRVIDAYRAKLIEERTPPKPVPTPVISVPRGSFRR